jgi:S-adenosylmethionine:tRNA ribosyltransferase-isomerase
LFDINDYNFDLPSEQIAQNPVVERDESRLLILDSRNGRLTDGKFGDVVGLLQPGDLLIVNDTKVFPARLVGKKESGGRVELFILDYPRTFGADAAGAGRRKAEVLGLLKSSKGGRVGGRLIFPESLLGEILEVFSDGKVRVALTFAGDFAAVLERCGRVPLPPYIRRTDETTADRERYQTVYARENGAVAAPTAGLHFTERLLATLNDRGVQLGRVTLHVGYGTFAPVREDDIRQHRIHREYYRLPEETAEMVNQTKAAGGRVWAVGTSTARVLETSAGPAGLLAAQEGWTELYIYPGYRFKVINNLITNFHLPKSSLLFLVSALAGREVLLAAYAHAVQKGYRFYSYGDAMAIMT